MWEILSYKRTFSCDGDSLVHDFENIPIQFGPIKTETHELGRHGWNLFFEQRTPKCVTKTRAKLIIYPSEQSMGFKFKFKSHIPWRSPTEIMRAIRDNEPETFVVAKSCILQDSRSQYIQKIKEYEENPFILLEKWSNGKIRNMNFEKTRQKNDNIIDLVEKIQQRNVERSNDQKLEERLQKLMLN